MWTIKAQINLRLCYSLPRLYKYLAEIQKVAYFTEQACFSRIGSQTVKDRFSHDVAQLMYVHVIPDHTTEDRPQPVR